jgi:transcriptional regulator with XRE-family HTH domain
MEIVMNIEYEQAFGKNIRKIRKSKKLTQDQLAAQLQIKGCDITRSAMAKIEVGQRHLYPDEIRLLKELLNVSFDEMFYFSNDKYISNKK